MNPAPLREAVAEALGWKPEIIAFGDFGAEHQFSEMPAYDTDLNAAAEMRRTLATKEDQAAFIRHLENEVSQSPNANLWSWALVDASPEQQCRAFLRAKGKELP